MMFRTNLLLMKWKTINLSKKKRYLLPRHYVRCTFERIWNILKIIWMFESELNIWMNAKSQIRFETQPTSPPQMRRKDSSSKTHECLTSEIPDHLNIFRIWSSTKVSIWVSSWLLIWYQKWRSTFLFFYRNTDFGQPTQIWKTRRWICMDSYFWSRNGTSFIKL